MKRSSVRVFAFALVLSLGSACGDTHAPPAPNRGEQAALGGDVAARVGAEVISVSLVQKVAADQHIPLREALRQLVDDAIAANAARERGLDRSLPTSWLLTAARARVTADRLVADAKAAGPPTDEEIRLLSERHWREVDRPPAVRVVHAVAQSGPDASPDARARARAVAEEILEAVRTARDAAEFEAKAKAVKHADSVNVVVQPLPAITEDGRSIEANENVDPKFASLAFSISALGETRMGETKFGWHVVRLVERIPEQRMDLDARRLAFGDAVHTERARTLTEARLAVLRATLPVVITPSSEPLMRTLHSMPPEAASSPQKR